MVKRALLLGLNYVGTPNQLNGCINDVNNMASYLMSTLGFSRSDIIILSDYTAVKPTRANIIKYLLLLIKKVVAGDSLFLVYSGHGDLIRDKSRDEISGMDSVLCPLDYATSGYIVDDDLRKYIIDAIPSGAQLTVVLDCCHNGTGCDLRYVHTDKSVVNANPANDSILSNANLSLMQKINQLQISVAQSVASYNKYSESKGNVFVISGCRDDQTSADTYENKQYGGALTISLLEVLNANRNISWSELLCQVSTIIKLKGYSQIIQFSSGKKTNMYSLNSFLA